MPGIGDLLFVLLLDPSMRRMRDMRHAQRRQLTLDVLNHLAASARIGSHCVLCYRAHDLTGEKVRKVNNEKTGSVVSLSSMLWQARPIVGMRCGRMEELEEWRKAKS